MPWRAEIGTKGYEGIFVVIQHSGNIALMKKYLPKFKAAAKTDKSLLWCTAYLTDRLRTTQNIPQVYGTQFMNDGSGYAPIEDLENLNNRRIEMRMIPFTEKELEKVLKNAKTE